MFGTQSRKILRDIWSRKARTALVSISIFVGVFGTITFFTMGDLVVRQLENDIDQDSLAMTRTFVAPNPAVTADNAQAIAALEAVPEVTAVEGQAVHSLFWKKPGEPKVRSSTMFSYSTPLESIQLEPMTLVDGRFPQPGNQELVVEQRFADQYDLDVNDEIVVNVLSQASSDEGTVIEETWRIVGAVRHPYGYYQDSFNIILPEDSVFAAFEDAQYLTGSSSFTSFYLRFDRFQNARAQLDAVKAALRSEPSYIEVFTMTEDPAANSLITSAEETGNVLAILAVMALIVAGFLVVNVVTSIVTEQKTQIGTMKSLGATQADNLMIYLGTAFVYGIIGVIPAVILGIPAGYFAAQGLAVVSLTEISEFGISVRAIAIGVGMGLAVPVLAAIIPVLNGTRVRIIDALTDRGIASRYGSGPAARLIAGLPLPINMRQGISNIVRKKGRMIFTTITLTVAVGTFMGVFAVFASFNELLNDFLNSYGYNLSASPSDSSDAARFESLLINNVDGLSSQGPAVSFSVEIDGYQKEYDPATGPPALFATGYDPAQQPFDLIIEEGTGLSPNSDEIIISSSIARATGHSIGDEVVIRGGGNQGTYTISGIASFPFDQIWFDWRTLSKLAGNVDANGEAVPQGYYLSVDQKNPTGADVDEKIDDINSVLQENGITATYGNIEQMSELFSGFLSQFAAIFNLAALLIALVGAVGLLSTLSMSVFERQKEIGVMRSIGASSSTIVGQFLTEGITVGFIAWLAGLPLGYLISSGIFAALDVPEQYDLGFPITAAIVGLFGMLIITALASFWPSITASRKTVSDILRYQ